MTFGWRALLACGLLSCGGKIEGSATMSEDPRAGSKTDADPPSGTTIPRSPTIAGSIASELDAPANLAIANGVLYFSDGQKLYACPTSGCGNRPKRLALVDSYITSVVTDGVRVLFTDSVDTGSVYEVVIGSNAREPRKLVTNLSQPRGLALANGFFYWTTFDGNIQRCSGTCDGGPETIARGEVGHPYGIAVDGDALFWTTEGAGNRMGEVRTCSIADCRPQSLARGQNYARAIAVDRSSIYWIADGDSTVRHCNRTSCNDIVDLPLAGQTGLAVDESHIYWSHFAAGWVESCELDCKKPTSLAQELPGPGSIVLDERSVYVATAGWSSTSAYQARAGMIVMRAK